MTQSLIQALIHRFNQEGVLYCHWKSNIDLAKTFEGELDIDLLVSNNSLACALEILMQLGFKAATPRWTPNPTGIFHYYGFDPSQKNLVHLHMFTRVLTGESFLKSHLLPFEEMLLEDPYFLNGLPVSAKEAELILFVLRTYIKYGSPLDAIRVIRSANKVREEAHWLKDGSDMNQVANLLEKYCPVVDKTTFAASLETLLKGDAFHKKLTFSRRIRKDLRSYQKYSFPGWLLGHIQLLEGTVIKKLRKQKGSKILSSGGTIIAIVGADATGKSTSVSETSRWLRKNFVVNTIHAGKPTSTLVTLPINLLLHLFKALRTKSRSTWKMEYEAPSSTNSIPDGNRNLNSLIYALRAVCLAWDRRALLLRARRASAQGEIVVCDRYPTNATGMMDSPRLREDPSQKGMTASVFNWLARVERKLYRQIPPPDIVLRLSVSLETAKKRNASREVVDDENYLQHRHQQAKEWYMPGTRLIKDINTDLSLDETLFSIKQAIWSSL